MTQYNKVIGFIKKCSFTELAFFIDFNKHKFVELHFNKQSRMQSKTTNC